MKTRTAVGHWGQYRGERPGPRPSNRFLSLTDLYCILWFKTGISVACGIFLLVLFHFLFLRQNFCNAY